MKTPIFPTLHLVLGLAVIAFSKAAAAGTLDGAVSSNSLSLARGFPTETLRGILIPREQWRPFPTLKDREDWQALPTAVSDRLLELGEKALTQSLPPLPATLYLGYARQGNRSDFERVFFERRVILQNLVLAECVEGKGRFLDAAGNALWSICEESTWCLPAHIGAQKAGVGLPDITEPIVDLFAGESAVTVAWTLYLLGPGLDRVSPQVRRRAEFELQRRILGPVLDRDNFGWMALNVTHPDRRPNNWTPWIAASVLTTTLLSEPNPDRRTQTVHKMLRSLDGFLRFYPSDGSCDEGPGYWGRAGGSLLDCLDLLHSASGGKLDFYAEPLIQEIGRFIYRTYIAGDYFVPIGDCSARFQPERGVVFRYGKCIQDPNLKALATHGASVESVLDDGFMDRRLNEVFNAAEILSSDSVPLPLLGEVWLGSVDLQLMTARSRAGSTDGLYVAAWGGHNAQSHNHNDVGNFLVFANGQPVFVDAGAPTYTAQTFSSKRYDHWAFQSAFHNLPTINGVMQSAGRQFAARAVACETNERIAQLQMDIAPAYPPTAKVKSWVRTVRLNRGQDVEITESFELAETRGETTLNLLTPLEPDTNRPGQVILQASAGVPSQSRLRLEYDAAKLTPAVERIAITDSRLAHSWGTNLNRLVLHPRSPALKDTWTLRLTEN
jgi:hypothetical protein